MRTSEGLSHKGHAITVDGSGRFCATVAGNELMAPSMAAIKKQVDKAIANALQPFSAFYLRGRGWEGDGPQYDEVKIVGVRQQGRSYKQLLWVDARGDGHETVFAVTDENRAAIANLQKIERSHHAAEERYRKSRGVAEAAIKRVPFPGETPEAADDGE